MGVKERREREKLQRRFDILDAAERIFFTKGYELSSMDDVAIEAELSKGTLYLYFKSKDELLHAVVERGYGILCSLKEEVKASSKNGLEKIRASGESFVRFATEYNHYYTLSLICQSKANDELDEVETPEMVACERKGMEALAYVIEFIIEGQNDGSVRKDLDPTTLAFQLWGSLAGIIQIAVLKKVHLVKEHGVDADKILELFYNLIEDALRA